jgi:hypothetical protein
MPALRSFQLASSYFLVVVVAAESPRNTATITANIPIGNQIPVVRKLAFVFRAPQTENAMEMNPISPVNRAISTRTV